MAGVVQRIPKSQPETSLEARLLAERLARTAADEMVSYAEMQALTGLDIQRRRRDLLDTARRIVLHEHHKVFGTITRVGVKCLPSLGILGVGEQDRRRLTRQARRTVQKLACAQPDALAQEQQYRLLAYTSIFGAVAALTHARTVQRAVRLQGAMPRPLDPVHYRDLFAQPTA